MKIVEITQGEFKAHSDGYDSICLGCFEWRAGEVEPDARKYEWPRRCGGCGSIRVYSADEALLMGRIEFTDDD